VHDLKMVRLKYCIYHLAIAIDFRLLDIDLILRAITSSRLQPRHYDKSEHNANDMSSISNAEGSRAFRSHGKPVYLMSNIAEAGESLEWWRKMQGSVSSYGNVISRIRIGKSDSPHELVDHSTICTFMTDPETKGTTTSSREKMVRDAMEKKRVIGVLIHRNHASLVKKNIAFPEGEEWALMGAYVTTDCWKETRKAEEVPHLMVRLQMVNTEDIWWESTTPLAAPSVGPKYGSCSLCNLPLHKRYQEREAFCCRLQCPSASNPIDASDAPLRYDPEYLTALEDISSVSLDGFEMLPPQPHQFSVEELEQRLIPRVKRKDKPSIRKIAEPWPGMREEMREQRSKLRILHKAGGRGYFCSICYRGNQRLVFTQLKCRHCKYILLNRAVPDVSFDRLVGNAWLEKLSVEALIDQCYFALPVVDRPTQINFGLRWRGEFFGIVFNLEYGNAIFLIVPTKDSTDKPGGSRSTFSAVRNLLQSGKLPVRRELIKDQQEQVPGLRTNHFGKNYGEPYNTAMETTTSPLTQQPEELRDIVSETATLAGEVSGKDCNSNENYVVAYGPNNSMDYHQDGEDDVKGNAIWSVSYGGPASMNFALTKKSLSGRGLSKQVFPPRVVRGALQFAKKQALIQSCVAGEITEADFWQQWKVLVKSKECEPSKTPEPILQFVIHGNGMIVIQAGESLNQIYRHQVDCDGIFRIVITGRILYIAEEQAARKARAETKSKGKAKVGKFEDDSPHDGSESEPEANDGTSTSNTKLKRKRKAVEPVVESEKRRRTVAEEPSATAALQGPPVATGPASTSAETSRPASSCVSTSGHDDFLGAHQGPRGGRCRTMTMSKLSSDKKWFCHKHADQAQ
jgi:alkylated DNA repair dioxygenase AlkB